MIDEEKEAWDKQAIEDTPPNAAFTVIDLIDKGITRFQEEVQVISTAAQQEAILEEMMGKSLDDCLVTINTVLGSRYVGGIRSYETLDEWQTCQRNWMYLEVIFGSADIIRQLPGPAKIFQFPNALMCGTKDKTRLETFKQHNANLDQIQKDLEDYLETKRMAFPRFYFLSNDELLEILSQAKEPRAVQPHLRKCSVDLLAMFSGEGERRPRDEWIGLHAGQIVATVAQMTWARDTETALRGEDKSSKDDLSAWSIAYKAELQKLIAMIRSPLTALVRKIVVALVTTDVHARDIIDELQEREVESPMDFLWQQQLRYYWKVDVDDCRISHSDALVNYGYEYMGATSRLVITPLTDRCWLTLTGSYALKLAIGIQCVGGSWVCLDEFNRIDIEVLSVIAQQLLVLREGRQAKKDRINFMGINISLIDHHVIITMNPVCFRPVSMMVPNYALIAEIMLFAEGFGDAKNLSRKMCKLYILCSEQLSQQPHYDYGLRAVNEDLVLIRALHLPLFAAIVLDLFPGIEIPPDDYGELSVALNEEILKAGLQLVPKFIGKVIQIIYRILAALMINLRAKGSKNPLFQNVKFQILNPKSIAMGELYGDDDKRWTVFDGPIDALWIENMNTVLDDNMTLCLANGQRIKLKSEMKCLFEVNDLAVASPATVSRIGVVYVTPTDLGFFPEFITTRLLQLFERRNGNEPALFHVDNGVKMDQPEAVLKGLMDKLYVFAYTWTVGAPCTKDFWEPFGEHTRELFEELCTPFDYYVDTKEGVFKNWTEIIPTFVYDAQAPYFDLMVPTADTTRFSYVMTHLIRVDKPCFITGVTGTGKTVASLVVQTSIESKLEKKRKNLLGAPSGRKPPVELLRQLLDHKGFYDRDKIFWKELENVLLFVGAAPPGGGRAPVTGRFTRHFNKMCDGCVTGTIEMYHRISEELLPTPSKFHYTFNLRDISKVFQGVLMIRPRKCQEPETFAKLWVHECQRIFYDRFINTDDQDWFKKQICETLSRHLKMPMSEGDLFDKPIVFIDFLKPDADPKFYECAPDLDALCHAARISRILRQPRGNAMLIGVGGSGKQSLTKIASFVGGMQCLSIEINRGYGIKEFREDIKTFMLKTGVEGKDLVFLFTDSQIVDETMLEDLNNVLNTGEVANLFAADETDQIVASMIEVCKANGIAETRDNCLSYFVSRVRDKLHIVLCMSPVGDALRAALVSVSQRFLANIDLGSADTQAAVVQMCGFVHRSIEKMSVAFYNELRRRIYTTPKSYLDLISLDRMKVGVTKLTETNDIVETLRGELEKLGPVLKEKGEAASAMLTQVAKDSAEANIVAETTKAADITEVKSFPNPPNAVRIVMEAICILLGEEPNDFIEMLQTYDKDNIPAARLKKLRRDYKVSKAGLGLCLWARAMDVYADIMTEQLKEVQATLKVKQDALKERLIRAEKLTNGLNSEGVRWKAAIDTLAQEHTDLIGDCFLSCACISYYGGFTGVYREKLIGIWLEKTVALRIPASKSFSEWQNQGLPTDDMQANSWLRKKEEANDVQITTMNDTNLLRVLEKCIRLAIFKQGARRLIRLGDSDVDYDDLFKLYMTTKMPNPHYLPEVCIKRPDIEERKVQLMLNMAEDKKQLAALEAKILKMLSESEGNILDDEAEITEVAINDTLDPMYQYSLAYYNMLFNRCIDMSEKSKDLDTRLKNIIDYTTLIIYQNICRGLFEKDKLLFSSLVCFQIMKDRGVIHEIEWNVLVRGPGAIDKVKQPMNPHPDLISAPAWNLIYGIEDVLQYTKPVEKAAPVEGEEAHPFGGLCEHIRKKFIHAENPDSEWTAWMKSPNIMEAPLPAPYNETVNNFQKLLLVKALREDKLQGAIATYVGMELGKPFATSPVASMADIYEDINNSTPCIFILSSGADPTGTLLRFAKGKNYGCGNGDWVCLQNCMLAKSWMPALDKIVSDVQARVKPIHKDFRLFLTSSPATYFPVSVLQNGVKMTNEPPKGFRANLLGNFANVIKEDDWEDEEIKLKGREVAWKKILCGLSFFHAQSDFETSVAVLKRFLTEQDIIPWDAINFATGHINYGDSYAFSKSDMMEYFEQLPHSDDPEVFGMHDNANVTFNTNESLVLMESILTLQPRASGGGGGKGPDEQVIDLAEVFESEAPDILDTETEAGETTFIIQSNGLLPSLAICLEQEIVKFNRLMNKMRSSLRDVKRAIRGMIVMSADLDDMYASFLNNKVPPIWEKVSFASLKTLASWVRDMGFMTASLQTFARKHMEAIDGLSFEFEVLRNGLQPELITEGPEDGVIVHGLFMEGARFDHETWKQAPNTYACPVYKTAVRKGVLSTTGMSTNFVVPVEMPINTNETEQKYILAGCAAILNLTD
eukprot:GSChrysophyteH1.ASY1.ANO1.1642.1 assembled CDS